MMRIQPEGRANVWEATPEFGIWNFHARRVYILIAARTLFVSISNSLLCIFSRNMFAVRVHPDDCCLHCCCLQTTIERREAAAMDVDESGAHVCNGFLFCELPCWC